METAQSLRDRILSVPDFRTVPVEVPEWGVTVHVRTLNGHQRVAVQKLRERAAKSGGETSDYLAIFPDLMQLFACDDQGEPLFSSADLVQLSAKPFDSIERVVMAGLTLNGMTEKATEGAKKN